MGRAHLLGHREREVLRRRAQRGWSPHALALAHGISLRTAYRYLCGDRPGLEIRLREAIDRWSERRGVELREGDAHSLARAIRNMVDHERTDSR